MAFRFSRDYWTIILLVIILAMGVEIIYLMIQNRKLRSLIQDPKKYFKVLTQNEVVPSISISDIDGNEVKFSYSSDAPYTLLFWFSAGCSACTDNFSFWNEIYRDYASENLRCFGMCVESPEDAKAFAAENNLAFPVINARDRYIVESYKGNVLPQTVLISPMGTVTGVWPGALGTEQEDRIISSLKQIQPSNPKGGDS